MLTVYNAIKRFIPRPLQIKLRRQHLRMKQAKHSVTWPIDHKAGHPPRGWTGWPNGKKFAVVITHDVEKNTGVPKCYPLVSLMERHGFRSSFYLVARDYTDPVDLRAHLRKKGFEIGIHGLHHHINPFRSDRYFKEYATGVNQYMKEWDSCGYRSPSMYHDLDMIHYLDIKYDCSTFDTDPFEPQPDGMRTIFPFWVPDPVRQGGYVELPYTLPQDFLLFILMQERDISIWKRKLKWIVDNGGMALFIVHPDYMSFNGSPTYQEYPASLFEEFLIHIKTTYADQYWNALPKDVADFICTQQGKEAYAK